MKEVIKKCIVAFCLASFCVAFVVPCQAQSESDQRAPFRTMAKKANIKSLRLRDTYMMTLTKDPDRPILTLDGEGALEVSFDELSHDVHNYTYTVLHLNADWTRSSLISSEYLQGFVTEDITYYQTSFNTHQLYTHYSLTFPNENMYPLVSGNYVIVIYEDGNPNDIVATACFSMIEPMVDINCQVLYATDKGINGLYQQLDISVVPFGINMRNANDIKLVVRQNNRHDNEVFGVSPSFYGPYKILYQHRPELIFEAGQQYQNFDTYSLYYGKGIDRIRFEGSAYHTYLFPSELRSQKPFVSSLDAHGQFVINAANVSDADTEADYTWVRFTLPVDPMWLDGSVYLCADWTYNLLASQDRMKYDETNKCYYYDAYLKQGGYDYLYLFKTKNNSVASTQRVEGSFWQTVNEYDIYVYYRPFGERYDRLAGFLRIRN